MINRTIFFLVLGAMPILALASSGMPRVWVYQNAEGNFMVLRSQKVEQDEYNGETQGPVRSRLHIYKERRGTFPTKPEFVTKSTCTFMSEPKEHIICSTSSAHFSGARFDLVEPNRADRKTKQVAKKYLADFARAGKRLAPYGIYSHSLFQCVSGCDGIYTPGLMVEVGLMGD